MAGRQARSAKPLPAISAENTDVVDAQTGDDRRHIVQDGDDAIADAELELRGAQPGRDGQVGAKQLPRLVDIAQRLRFDPRLPVTREFDHGLLALAADDLASGFDVQDRGRRRRRVRP